MKNLYQIGALCACVLSLLSPGLQADTLTWHLDITFNDGGTATGSFNYDATSGRHDEFSIGTFSNINITTTAGTILGGTSYSQPKPIAQNAPSLLILVEELPIIPESTIGISLRFDGDLTDAGGTVPLVTGLSGGREAVCFDSECRLISTQRYPVTGSVTAIPILPLESRLEDLAYYDPNLDITWSASPFMSGIYLWDRQMTWVAGLDIGGVTGWRLPSGDVNGDGIVVDCQSVSFSDCMDNEMGFIYWREGITGDTPEPFDFVGLAGGFFTSTEYLVVGLRRGVWINGFIHGDQIVGVQSTYMTFAWAVHDGDVFGDSDGDGIPDDLDPDFIADVVITLPIGVFANNGDPEGQRNGVLSRLADIEQDIADGDISGAIRALQNLRRKVDGCGATADRNDWITDCSSQIEVRDLIDLLIMNLGG